MDNLFRLGTTEMTKKLYAIEAEMREDAYPLKQQMMLNADTSTNAYKFICEIFEYMKKWYRPEECTVLSMMKVLYRIAATGEYSCLQEIDELGFKDCVWEKIEGDDGYKSMIYAFDLLKYYYLVYEKEMQSNTVWYEMEKICKKSKTLLPLKKTEKKEKKEVKDDEKNFMRALKKHMDTYYVGQEDLKKKICVMLYQWLYHEERSNLLMVGPTGSGKSYLVETIRSFPGIKMPVVSYDCSALTPNGFTGNDVADIFKKVREAILDNSGATPAMREMLKGAGRMRKEDSTKRCIVYLDEIDKIINYSFDSKGGSVNAMVQQQLLSALSGAETIADIDSSRILFILGGAFPRIDDLEKEKMKNVVGFNAGSTQTVDFHDTLREKIKAIGGEPEFIGRIEDIVQLSKLTREDLKIILMDKNMGAFAKRKKVYEQSGLILEIEEDVVESILDLVVKEDAGARSVKNIVKKFTDDKYIFDMLDNGFDVMKIHKGMLYGESPVFMKGGRDYGQIRERA